MAETIRFYGRHFWRSLLLGLGPAVIADAGYFVGFHPWLGAVVAGWILLATASYVGGALLVTGARPGRRVAGTAFAVGAAVSLPLLAGFVWLAPLGLAVPAVVAERIPLRAAFSRGLELARADYAHALGAQVTLLLVVFLTQVLLTALLHGASQQSTHVSAFLANLVVSPILFLGGALLYHDQAARAKLKSGTRAPREA